MAESRTPRYPCSLKAGDKVLQTMQGLLDLLSRGLAAACSSPTARGMYCCCIAVGVLLLLLGVLGLCREQLLQLMDDTA
jgi:hypothetical protein